MGSIYGLEDKSGIGIYEGDKLKNGDDTWIVEYSEKDGMFIIYTEKLTKDFSEMISKWFEITGNIHNK